MAGGTGTVTAAIGQDSGNQVIGGGLHHAAACIGGNGALGSIVLDEGNPGHFLRLNLFGQ
jgi:hypothetical protein